MLEDVVFIDEKVYQQIKRIMCKSNDYFTKEQFVELINNVKIWKL